MFLKLKCKLFECYDIDGEVQHTFENKISRLENGNFCILEDYILDALTFPKEKNLFLDYGLFGKVDWSLYNTDKITCDKRNNLLLFYGTGKDYEQIYMDIPPEDLKKEIEKIKDKICNLGIEKETVDKSSSDYETDFQKIKAEMMFAKIKNECR